MVGIGKGYANVMQQRTVFQQLALIVPKRMQAVLPAAVEKLQRQIRNMAAMLLIEPL